MNALRSVVPARLAPLSRPFGLLKGINPLLTPSLLQVLRSAGHGDEIAIVDCNFPAASVAAETVTEVPVELAGADVVQAVDAICSVMPVDFFIEKPVQFMAPMPGDDLPPLGAEAHEQGTAAIHAHAPGVTVVGLERFAFYERAKGAYAIVQAVGERRPYANFIVSRAALALIHVARSRMIILQLGLTLPRLSLHVLRVNRSRRAW